MTGRKIVQIERLQAIRDRFRRKLDSKYGGGRRSNITKSKFLITVLAQIEQRRSNFRLGFFGEDFTK